MALPVKLERVHYYRIAGRYIFAGDLFVSRGRIYFFPEVDLAEQRREVYEILPHQFALVGLVVIYLAQNLKSYASRNELWEDGISNEQFQKKADAYIAALKEERKEK